MRRTTLFPLTVILAASACVAGPTPEKTQPATPSVARTDSVAVGAIDDRDLAPPASNRERVIRELASEGTRVDGTQQFRMTARGPQRPGKADRVTGRLHALDAKGNDEPLARVSYTAGGSRGETRLTGPDGRFEVPATATAVTFTLANEHWSLGGKDGAYRWVLPVHGAGDVGVVMPEKGSANAQAAWIHLLFVKAERQIQGYGVGLDWWKNPVKTVWPGDADYYQWGTLNLTGAHQWDVNGHELGHALSDQAFNMRFGGGQHYIDRCYNATIAWSEGVASFISAVISIDPADTDAKFEFMVPRRAPLRYENVPADVCEGQENEWRVGAACWDLFDTHADGKDTLSLPLPTLWKAWGKGNGARPITSLNDAYHLITNAAPDQAGSIRQAMAQNTMPFQFPALTR